MTSNLTSPGGPGRAASLPFDPGQLDVDRPTLGAACSTRSSIVTMEPSAPG
jgi:hypothetical protein